MALLGLFVAFFLMEMFRGYYFRVQENLHQRAYLLSLSLIPALNFRDNKDLMLSLKSLEKEPDIKAAIVLSKSKAILAEYYRDQHETKRIEQGWNFNSYTISHDIEDNQEHIGTLLIAKDLSAILRELALYLSIFGLAILMIGHFARASTLFVKKMINKSFEGLRQSISTLKHDPATILDINSLMSESAQEFHNFIIEFEDMRQTIQARDKLLLQANQKLEQRVAERTEELRILHEKLVNEAHNAGMADVASGILHNFGNVMNSLQIELETLRDNTLHSPYVKHLENLYQLLEQPTQLQEILHDSEKSHRLTALSQALRTQQVEDQDQQAAQLKRTLNQLQVMRSILQYQQNFIKGKESFQDIPIREALDLVLNIKHSVLNQNGIKLTIEGQDKELVHVHKYKFVHVITNLIVNSIDAMKETPMALRRIMISCQVETNALVLRFEDNGSGIPLEVRDRIFRYGFSTKSSGHGLGLHSSAIYMKEMSGTLKLASSQPVQGAAFEISVLLSSSLEKTLAGGNG